VTPEVILNLKT